jgi:exonuclease SbcD
MRILHTSDWHIGRSLVGFDLHEPQQTFIDHIIKVVKEEKVDVLLISGDVYDRALPSLTSIDLLNYALSHLSKITKVVITSGNHDSSRRLGFGKDLLETANIFIRTTVNDIERPALFPIDGGQLAIYGIPYLDPYTTASQLIERDADGKLPAASHHTVLAAAMAKIAANKKSVKANKSIVMSHAWYAGGDPSESDTNIGGLGQASLELLKGFDYAALGHLHKPKEIENHIRYSGSALPYSFSEKDKPKLSYLVDLSKNPIDVREIPSPVYKTMHILEDTMDNLLRSSKYNGLENQFVKIRITDKNAPVNPKVALSDRFAFIVELYSDSVLKQIKDFEAIRLMSPQELVGSFLAEIRNDPADAWEEKEIEAAISRLQAGVPLEDLDSDSECDHTEEAESKEEVEA